MTYSMNQAIHISHRRWNKNKQFNYVDNKINESETWKKKNSKAANSPTDFFMSFTRSQDKVYMSLILVKPALPIDIARYQVFVYCVFIEPQQVIQKQPCWEIFSCSTRDKCSRQSRMLKIRSPPVFIKCLIDHKKIVIRKLTHKILIEIRKDFGDIEFTGVGRNFLGLLFKKCSFWTSILFIFC